MLEKDLFDFLSADTAILSKVGDGTRARIFPLFIPQKKNMQDQMPCIVYTITSEQRQQTYCGTSPLVQLSVSFDLYAATADKARELSDAVRALLIDYRGMIGDMNVRNVSLDNSMTQYDMDPGLMRVIDMYTIWYQKES